jgi:hypothetical protein
MCDLGEGTASRLVVSPDDRLASVSSRVSALAKRYGWGIHNNAEGKIALIAVESPEYKRLMNDPRTTKIKAFRSKRA